MHLGLCHGIPDLLKFELDPLSDPQPRVVVGELDLEAGRLRPGQFVGVDEDAPRPAEFAADESRERFPLLVIGGISMYATARPAPS